MIDSIDKGTVQQILEILGVAAMFFVAFVVVVGLAIFTYIRNSKLRKRNAGVYIQIARQTGWNFSPGMIAAASAYFSYLDSRAIPGSTLFGSPTTNLLVGANANNTQFISFDYEYTNAVSRPVSSSWSRLPSTTYYEKGVLLISSSLKLSPFTVELNGKTGAGIESLIGTPSKLNFFGNFNISGDDQFVVQKFSEPDISPTFNNAGVVRVIGHTNFIAVFFRRSKADVPDLNRIRYQLDLTHHLANRLIRQ